MNDFDQLLERELHLMLDRVVAARPPARGERRRRPELTLVIVPAEVDPMADSVPLIEPVPVTATPLH